MARLLIGSETTPTPTESSVPPGAIFACKFTAAVSGTVEALTVKVGHEQAATEAWFGVYADAAGFPGVLLEQHKTAQFPAFERLIEVAGFSVTVVAGTAYWLAAKPVKTLPAHPLRPITNTGALEGTERQSVAAEGGGLLELPEAEWTILMFGGPQIFFGTGVGVPPHSAGLVEARQKGGNA